MIGWVGVPKGGWVGGWLIGLGFTLRGKRTLMKTESQLWRRDPASEKACSYPLYCAHFCRLSRNRLKGLGCTIPLIHCSPGLLLFDTATLPPRIVASHLFAAPPSFPHGLRMFPLVILVAFSFHICLSFFFLFFSFCTETYFCAK